MKYWRKTEKEDLIKFYILYCNECDEEFAVDKEFLGIVTCPYCGGEVEN